MNASSSEHILLLKKSMDLLGWNLVRQALSGQACSDAARERCLALLPERDFEGAQNALEETAEIISLNESGESFPMVAFADTRPILGDVAMHGIIDPAQGLQMLRFLRLARGIRDYLTKKNGAPRLQELAARLDPLLPLLKELDRCIDEEGEIKENASPELREAIRAVQAVKEKLESVAAKLLASAEFKDAIQDSYSTEREGRLVLPVKAEWKTRIDGIVHDSSGSGATLFIEPTKIIPLNNQLKINRLKVEQEKLKILRALAGEIAANDPILMIDLETLVILDMIHARAGLARSMRARQVTLNREGRISLKQARNPELLVNRQNVIPNDIGWKDGVRVIVISGPNTGGKTVTLKTIGLMALMARAGMFLPAEENSEIGFFPQVYADIGDDQNIQLSLSTFSAHLGKIVSVLNHADPGSLILLDELGIATDPVQGAALAEAILLELKQRGMMTLVSTHYLSIKTLAQTQDGFLNACTEFNPESLSPTYKLIFGVPGNSAALETAERLGLHGDVLRRAREIYKEKDTRADSLLQDLHRQKLQLEQEKEVLARQLEETRRLQEEHRLVVEKMRVEERDFRKNKAKRLQELTREAKGEIQKMLQEIKGTKDIQKIRKVEKQIHSLGQVPPSATRPDMDEWDVPPERLRKGDAVMLDTYGTRGELLENLEGKDKVKIKLGNLETLVELKRLRGNSKISSGGHKKTLAQKVEITVQPQPGAGAKLTCDLRGMRVDEAKSVLESFVDQAMLNKLGRIKIIHGHGMGAIKGLVRDYLESCGIGKNVSSGERQEGGDGVTIVEF